MNRIDVSRYLPRSLMVQLQQEESRIMALGTAKRFMRDSSEGADGLEMTALSHTLTEKKWVLTTTQISTGGTDRVSALLESHVHLDEPTGRTHTDIRLGWQSYVASLRIAIGLCAGNLGVDDSSDVSRSSGSFLNTVRRAFCLERIRGPVMTGRSKALLDAFPFRTDRLAGSHADDRRTGCRTNKKDASHVTILLATTLFSHRQAFSLP